MPSVFHKDLAKTVSEAVVAAVKGEGPGVGRGEALAAGAVGASPVVGARTPE